MKRRAVMAGVLLAVAACSGAGGSGADAGTEVACRHFRNVARDAADGILTDTELRDKLSEVERDARGSTDPDIVSTARALLAAFTSGGDQVAAIAAFGDACRVHDL